MLYKEYVLDGKNRRELETEIKFNIAVSRIDNVELVMFKLPFCEDEKTQSRVVNCMTSVLRSLARDNAIQFFLTEDGSKKATVESEFLFNKYSEYISFEDSAFLRVYVKM